MKKSILILVLSLQAITAVVNADNRNFLLQKTQPQHIFINNRILAQVNGKAISVIDLMKKMDMIFYRQFPQYSSSIEARFQFYNMSWKSVLKELIDKELIMADAAEVKMEISNGDVRQEMENMFGPNIIANLDKAGLSYEEASKIVKEDLTLKKMMMMRVNMKAARSVTPSDVKLAYEAYAKANTNPNSWRYQLISIKGKDEASCSQAAHFAHQLLVNDGVDIKELESKIQSDPQMANLADYTVSEEYTRTDKEISESYRNILAAIKPGTYSAPILQEGRSKNSKIFRIFYFKELIPSTTPSLSSVEAKLKTQLIDKRIDEEGDSYLNRLKEHFSIQGSENNPLYPKDFRPFILK